MTNGDIRRRVAIRGIVALLAAAHLGLAAGAQDPPRVRFQHLTNRDGLSQVSVNAILQDRQGFLWIGTADGLNRYDGYEFEIFRPDRRDPNSLASAWILALHEDRSGALWIGTRGGLDRFDPVRGRFQHFRHDPDTPDTLSHDIVLAIYQDRAGVLWIGTQNGLDRFDVGEERVLRVSPPPDTPAGANLGPVQALCEDRSGALWIGTQQGLVRLDASRRHWQSSRHDPEDPESLSHDDVRALYEDRDGALWVGTLGGGLDRLDKSQGRLAEAVFEHHRQHPGDPHSLGHDKVWAILGDRSGILWIATRGGGINRFDPSTGIFTGFRHDPGDPASLSYDNVLSLYEDQLGILWVGTIGAGLSYLDPLREGLAHYRHDPGDPRSLSYDTVFAIHEDRRGVLWVGTDIGGLNRYDPDLDGFHQYRHDPADPESLSHDEVRAILEDRSGALWIGTHGGGLNRMDPVSERFTRYRHDPANLESLSYDEVLALLEDESGDLWVGTEGGGLNRFDPATERFLRYRYDPGDEASLAHGEVWALHQEAESGALWVGTAGGLNRLAGESFVRYRNDPDDPDSLNHNLVYDIHEDSAGTLWIGTGGGGLDRFDRATESFTHLTEADGLSNDVVYGILDDDQGWLWLSTNHGLSRYDPDGGQIVTYDLGDGLQDNEFNWESHHRGADGTLYFGGIHGFNRFRPEVFRENRRVPPIVLTSFKVFGREARFDRAVTYLRKIELTHRETFFSFEFAALDFTRPGKNQYAYMLDDFDQGWIPAGTRRYASYTNVPAGRYSFRIKGSNNDGLWNEEGTAVEIVISSPPWKRWWAYLAYVAAFALVLGSMVATQRRKLDQERAIADRERAVSARLRDVDRLRDEFLANTSHELRTPLHGITGLAESLLEGGDRRAPGGNQADLAMIVASGRRLAGLVDDILDFTQLAHGNLELRRRPVDLHTLTEVILALSRPLVRNKQLELRNSIPADLPPADADENRLQQILHNLIGNAVKFTEEGTVEVTARVEANELVVRVTDTGTGIPSGELERIFEAFEQVDGSTERSFGGTGLGLAITRRLVELHGGTLGVESKLGEGSTFLFSLPVSTEGKPAPADSGGVIARLQEIGELPDSRECIDRPDTNGTEGRRVEDRQERILIVDDEPVNRQVLVQFLSPEGYRLVQASSGPEALTLLAAQDFDLVLLDVMMGSMSGYEVCRALRRSYSSNDLPVIFLTARNQVVDLLVGLSAGGNDYLAKPISRDELRARVRTHLELSSAHQRLKLLVEERTVQVEERERLIGELRTSNEELARFNYTVSHDLRNPLVTIKNFLGTVRNDLAAGDPQRLRRDLERIDAAAQRMHQLLDDLLEFSRAGHANRPPEEVPFGELVREAADLLAFAIADRGVELLIAPDLPVVVGDRGRLLQVVQNLLENALKFLGEQSAPRIEVGARSGGEERIFWVRDNGIGIDPRYHEKVFDLFDRLDQAIEGSGVGLTLVKRIVEGHGGRVWVESKGPGAGSTFYFTLPIDRSSLSLSPPTPSPDLRP